jgi:hypothetical protein
MSGLKLGLFSSMPSVLVVDPHRSDEPAVPALHDDEAGAS